MECRELPDAIRAAGVEALLVDQMEPAGGAVAERLGLPFITVCNALLINRDPDCAAAVHAVGVHGCRGGRACAIASAMQSRTG